MEQSCDRHSPSQSKTENQQEMKTDIDENEEEGKPQQHNEEESEGDEEETDKEATEEEANAEMLQVSTKHAELKMKTQRAQSNEFMGEELAGKEEYFSESEDSDEDDLRQRPQLVRQAGTYEYMIDYAEPTPEIIKAFVHKRHLRKPEDGKKYSFWKSNIGHLFKRKNVSEGEAAVEDLGPGISSYFNFLLLYSFAFFVFGLLTIPSLSLNYFIGQNGAFKLTNLMVGNLFREEDANEVEISNTYDDPSFGRRAVAVGEVVMDFLVVVLFVILSEYSIAHYKKKEYHWEASNPKLEHFTIEVTNLPARVTYDELKTHFTNLADRVRQERENQKEGEEEADEENAEEEDEEYTGEPVVDIQIVTTTRDKLIFALKMASLSKEAESKEAKYFLAQKRRDEGRISHARFLLIARDYGNAVERLRVFWEKEGHHNTDEEKTIKAFITFGSVQDKLGVLEMHHRKFSFKDLCRKQDLTTLDLRIGEKKLKVAHAAPPSLIRWEHMEYKQRDRQSRGCLGVFGVALTLLISAIALTSVSKGEDLFLEDANNSNDSKFLSIVKEYGFLLATGLLVNGLNIVLEYLIAKSVKFEKPEDRSKEEKNLFVRMFIATYVNTAIVALLAKIDYEKLFDFQSNLIPDGGFLDFTNTWYEEVGTDITVIALVNIFSPHVLLLGSYFYLSYKRLCVKPISLADMEKTFLGPEFLLPLRYAQTMVTIYFTLTYSAGIPILYFVTAATLYVQFVVDKFCLLKFYRKPPLYTNEIVIWICKGMKIGVIVHTVFAILMFSEPGIFPFNNKRDEDDDEFVTKLINRTLLGNPVALLTAVLILLVIYQILKQFQEGIVLLVKLGKKLSFVFKKVFGFILYLVLLCCGDKCKCCCTGNCMKSSRPEEEAMLSEYNQLEHLQRKRDKMKLDVTSLQGLSSYNILANPLYASRFKLRGNKSYTALMQENGAIHSTAQVLPLLDRGSTRKQARIVFQRSTRNLKRGKTGGPKAKTAATVSNPKVQETLDEMI